MTAFVAGDAEGRSTRYHGRHFLSTLPVRELIRAMSPAAPDEVIRAADSLKYRDFLTVVLIVDRAETFPDNWIYIHEPDVKVGRVQNFKNWSPDLVPDPSKTSLGLEYFCFEGDDLWTTSDADLIELGRREIEAIGLARASEVIDGCVVRMPKAYPVYDDHYQAHLAVIRGWLRTLPNLELAGRNGMHKYNNQDHSMMTALLAARNILGAGLVRHLEGQHRRRVSRRGGRGRPDRRPRRPAGGRDRLTGGSPAVATGPEALTGDPLTPSLSPLGRGRPPAPSVTVCALGEGVSAPSPHRGEGARRADEGSRGSFR